MRSVCLSQLLKTVLVPQGEGLTGFERNFIEPMGKISALDT